MAFKTIVIAAALFCGLGSFAQAQQVAYPPSQEKIIPESRLKEASELLAATGLATQMDAMYSTMIDASSSQIPDDKKVKFKELMTNFLKKYMSYESLKSDLSRIYAEEFTEQELKEITNFYLTPVGKKVNQKLGSLMQKGVTLGQNRMQAHLPEFQEELKKAFPNQ